MERLKISTSVGLFRVPTDDIAYIEASGNYCDVHLFNGESVTMTFQLHYGSPKSSACCNKTSSFAWGKA